MGDVTELEVTVGEIFTVGMSTSRSAYMGSRFVRYVRLPESINPARELLDGLPLHEGLAQGLEGRPYFSYELLATRQGTFDVSLELVSCRGSIAQAQRYRVSVKKKRKARKSS